VHDGDALADPCHETKRHGKGSVLFLNLFSTGRILSALACVSRPPPVAAAPPPFLLARAPRVELGVLVSRVADGCKVISPVPPR
jgi:hypothetical protein